MDASLNGTERKESWRMQRQVTGQERKQESRDVLGSLFYNKLLLRNLIQSRETVPMLRY